jgi:fusaric acid resistance family protein
MQSLLPRSSSAVALALACLASFSLARYASAHIHSLSRGDDLIAGLWAVIATAFVFRTTENESVTAAKTRLAATAMSFALCFAYLLILPFHAWGMAVLIAVGAFVLISLGQAGDVGVAAITTAAVTVIAAISSHSAWQQPLIGAVATTAGISIGLLASWLANMKCVEGLPHRANAAK